MKKKQRTQSLSLSLSKKKWIQVNRDDNKMSSQFFEEPNQRKFFFFLCSVEAFPIYWRCRFFSQVIDEDGNITRID